MTGTEIAKAYIQILPSMQGIRDKLNEGMGGAGSSAGQKAGSSFVSKFKALIAAAGIGKLLAQTITEGMNLQQNLGGTEVVFGEFAKTVQEQAKQAYKNMGTSASDYMATANKMASLFQGSGLEQQRSMELTTQAMQRAADVASVMGIDTATAMESIAGAAKGNFTMMDNLGVAMNATTLEAYALSKGLDFAWDSASNAEKAELAMQMFFENTEQYAGNFARESEETISGSFSALKSSAENLLASLMLGNDIGESWAGFKESIGGVVSAFATLLENSEAMQSFTGWLKENEQLLTLLGIAVGTLAVAIGAYSIATNWATIVTNVHTVATKIATAATAAYSAVTAFLTSPITLVVLAVGALIAIIYLLVKNWDTVKETAANVWDAIKNAWNAVASWFSENVIEPVKTLFSDLFGPMLSIGEELVSGLWQGISDSYQWIKDKITGWVGNVLDFLKELFGIHSPSRETAYMGDMLARGLAQGISDGKGEISKAINDVTKMTTGTFETGLNIRAAGALSEASFSFENASFTASAVFADEVKALGRKIENMRVVLDTGRTVGGILAETDRQLGARQIITQRGVC